MDPRGEAVRTRRAFGVSIAWLAAVVGAALVFAVRPEDSFTGSGSSLVLAGLVLATASDASVGAILILRRPGNVIGLVLMFAAILAAVTLFTWVFGAALTEQRGEHDVLAGAVSLTGALGFFPTMFVGGPLLALLFPTGRLPGPRWRWPVGAIIAAIAVPSAEGLRHPGRIAGTAVDNPFGASGFSGSEAFWTVGVTLIYASLPVALLLAVVAVIVRFRRSGGIERAQLKWFVAAIFAVGTLVVLALADGGLDLGLYAGTSPTIFDVLAAASLSLPPIAIGVAILRHHLFEIDRIISRTLSWAVLSGLLVGVYAGAVLLLQTMLGGVIQGQTVAAAASTLLAAALFQPLRRRVQAAVDHRFNRAHYDAERTAIDFAERLNDEMDLAALSGDITDVVDTALHPRTVGVWIRAPHTTSP
jgi:hypothetical protein